MSTSELVPLGGADSANVAWRQQPGASYLRHRDALTAGWPVAPGIVEAACRYLIKDRLDVTGARWGLPGAEAILKRRATHSNGDFDDFWAWHLAQEHQRVHHNRYTHPATTT